MTLTRLRGQFDRPARVASRRDGRRLATGTFDFVSDELLANVREGKLPNVLFDLRLDAVREVKIPEEIAKDVADEITEKLVQERAVVCDLCSTLPSGPACVTACPHDAAIRVDARSEFPIR